MPNKPAAIKALRQAKKATIKHNALKNTLRNLEKKIKKAIAAKEKKIAQTLAKDWQKTCDKAAKVKAIKSNTANRLKSRLMNKINSFLPPMQIFNDRNILKLHHTLFSLLSLNFSHKSIE